MAKLERAQNTAYQNKDQTQTPTKMGATKKMMNKQQQNRRLRTDSSRSHRLELILLLDSAAVKTQN